MKYALSSLYFLSMAENNDNSGDSRNDGVCDLTLFALSLFLSLSHFSFLSFFLSGGGGSFIK